MEDAVSVHEAFAAEGKANDGGRRDFYGVFDDHGCSHVAEACRDRMHELLAEELAAAADTFGSASAVAWTAAMERSFTRMDAELMSAGGRAVAAANGTCRCDTHKCDHVDVGSTAVVAVVEERRVVVANCGDSHALLCRGGGGDPAVPTAQLATAAAAAVSAPTDALSLCSSVGPMLPRHSNHFQNSRGR